MLKSRALTGALVVGAVGIASLFAASPANAATLPAGQRITVIDYYQSFSHFYEASPADATMTVVGVPQNLNEDDLAAVDVNNDGIGYAIGNYYSDGEESTLYAADANTGILSNPLEIILDFGDVQVEAEYCSALDYTAGVLMAICYETTEQDDEIGYWGILDPTAVPGEAWLTPLYQFDDEAFIYFDSMAVHPISGLVYAVGYTEGGIALYTLSQDLGATLVTTMDREAYGLDFDSSGQAWVTTWVTLTDPAVDVSTLATLNLVDGSNPFIEAMTFGGGYFPTPLIMPITVWGAAALPATGPADSTALAVGAAGFLLLGAILAVGAIVRRRPIES